jgi:sec-independent protein translocase protein TatA
MVPHVCGGRMRTMGELSIYHWLVVLAIVVLLFGGRKIPDLMKGLGEGIRSFKGALSGDTNLPVSTNAISEKDKRQRQIDKD